VDDGRRYGICRAIWGICFMGIMMRVRKEEGYVSLNKREGEGRESDFRRLCDGMGMYW
jgi:hypothetical protein